MDEKQMAALTEGFAIKADKMRVLAKEGVSRGDIARFLGVRYQQVRNTLEGDKRTGYAPDLAAGPAHAGGPAGPDASPFRLIDVGKDGFATLPPDLVGDLVDEAEPLYAVATKDGIFVSSLKGMNARVQASFR